LVPQAVAVAEALELIGDDRLHELADRGAGDVILGKGADP